MQMITPDEIDFAFYERVTDHQQKIKSASVYVQALLDKLESGTTEKKVYLPWLKTREQLQFRPGEVTIWGGPNGSGKSLVTGQVALSLAAQGEKVCIASFEMKPTKTIERMGRQFTAYSINDPYGMSEPAIRKAMVSAYEVSIHARHH